MFDAKRVRQTGRPIDETDARRRLAAAFGRFGRPKPVQ
jgi:hypothetical protein